jgi:hypothetical protein
VIDARVDEIKTAMAKDSQRPLAKALKKVAP